LRFAASWRISILQKRWPEYIDSGCNALSREAGLANIAAPAKN
jgi:hypothetical protein